MRSALITGATGFIGSHLARRLARTGWTVHALVRPDSDISAIPAEATVHRHDGSLQQLTAIARASQPTIVFHLASLYLAQHRPEQVDELVASNILFPARLAQAMMDAGASRLVNTGTAWQHYRTRDYNPVNLYAASKQACEDLLRYFHDAHDLSVVTLKLFDTFGTGDKRRKLVQVLVDAAVKGEPVGMSPGEQVLDLTHVDDVVDAFLVAAECLMAAGDPLFEAFLVSGRRQTARELVTQVERAIGRTINVDFNARPYREREVMVPVETAPETCLPHWSPRRDFDQSLRSLAGEYGES